MRQDPGWKRWLPLIFAICLLASCASSARGQCRPPRFRKVKDYGGSVYISVSPRDFTIDKLTCLGRTLRGELRDGETFGAVFFTSADAALHFRPPIEGHPPKYQEWATQLHAMYSADKTQHHLQETLDLIPLGYDQQISTQETSTRIALPIATAASCRLEVGHRCLMVVGRSLTYPEEGLRKRASGRIVLIGKINADGSAKAVRVLEADVSPSDGKDALASAALRDVRQWQFDAGNRTEPFRLTFLYRIDGALPQGMDCQVQWSLPDEVIIRGRPLE